MQRKKTLITAIIIIIITLMTNSVSLQQVFTEIFYELTLYNVV